MWRLNTPKAAEAGLSLLGLVMLLIGLGQIPGLHDDEAWLIHAVAELGQEPWPLSGMSPYSGALQVYLLWPLMELFGHPVEVLRAVAAVCGAACVFICMRLHGALGCKTHGAWVGMLLVSSPAVVPFFRFAVEVTTWVPLLCLTGLLLLLREAGLEGPARPRSGLRYRVVLAGLLLGLAAYTHVIAICVPLAAALAVAVTTRGRCLRHPVFWQAALGLVAGLAPRLLQLPSLDAAWTASRMVDSSPTQLLGDLLWSPALLAGLWDGDLVFRRFTGDCWLPVLPHATAALLGLVAWRAVLAVRGRAPLSRADWLLLQFLAAYLLLLLLSSPALSLRYFSLLALLATVALVWLAGPIMERGRRSRLVVQLILCAVVLLNGVYLAGNYFYAFMRTGGAPSVFPLGRRLTETSNHFVRTDLLYRQLVEQRVEQVLATHFIVGPLRVHDRANGRLRFDELQPGEPVPRVGVGRTALVFYNGPMVRDGRRFDMRGRDVIEAAGGERFVRSPLFTRGFLVFIQEPRAR